MEPFINELLSQASEHAMIRGNVLTDQTKASLFPGHNIKLLPVLEQNASKLCLLSLPAFSLLLQWFLAFHLRALTEKSHAI